MEYTDAMTLRWSADLRMTTDGSHVLRLGPGTWVIVIVGSFTVVDEVSTMTSLAKPPHSESLDPMLPPIQTRGKAFEVVDFSMIHDDSGTYMRVGEPFIWR